jgi:hypothetical protein
MDKKCIVRPHTIFFRAPLFPNVNRWQLIFSQKKILLHKNAYLSHVRNLIFQHWCIRKPCCSEKFNDFGNLQNFLNICIVQNFRKLFSLSLHVFENTISPIISFLEIWPYLLTSLKYTTSDKIWQYFIISGIDEYIEIVVRKGSEFVGKNLL